MAPSVTATQLIRIARLRRFVGVFARGGDREGAAEALLELSRISHAGGLRGEALKRARQAAELLAEEDASEPGIRSLLQLGAVCLDLGDADTASHACAIARERASELAEPTRSELIGCAALLAGVAHSLAGEDAEARALLDEARDRLVASRHPEGAALALTQLGLLDVAAERWAPARICFRFAIEFHRASGDDLAAAEVGALAARSLAPELHADSDAWFRDAIAFAECASAHDLVAELTIDRAELLERTGAVSEATALATDGALRCAHVTNAAAARRLLLRARMLLGRNAGLPAEALRHLEAAFEHALDLRDPEALGGVMELLVSGLVATRFDAAGWQLVDRFRNRLAETGFPALAETAERALDELGGSEQHDDGAG